VKRTVSTEPRVRIGAGTLGFFAGWRTNSGISGSKTLGCAPLSTLKRGSKTLGSYIWTLNRIFITGPQVIYERDRAGRRREKRVTVHSRLVDVSLESERDQVGDEHPYAFNLATGDWARPYVGHDGRMVAQLLRSVMEFDPRQGVGLKAMRLGLYLSFQWRIRSSRANYDQTWAVRILLDGARIPVEADSRLYTRFRDQKALAAGSGKGNKRARRR